ncbi:MAG: hypothetical protein QM736_03810 [Vicinamibacterales bacterium]
MMSSVNSSAPPAKYPSWLYEALATVAESSFFASAEQCERATFLEHARAERAWLQARVHFAGGMSGEVVCTVPESLVRELAATFAGLDPEEEIREGARRGSRRRVREHGLRTLADARVRSEPVQAVGPDRELARDGQ